MRFDNGVISEIDLRLAESLAESARAAYAQQQRLRMQDENALALLLGAPVPAEAIEGGVERPRWRRADGRRAAPACPPTC